ncbi:phospholipid scramblase 1-like isoform X1 [Strongylocentrotus purpuratus]|uniref:Phospholipid scramblase n=2 Tax=Strongylocentrotus purpuratus TaxID=7668 RepID=A0A7M7NWJ2_STRPU|nr:phospholipid scramblase 1-like isoform X1 [Strongylocentrotus purpuratus]
MTDNYTQKPVSSQPGMPGEWMPMPQVQSSPNCPPGLEYLAQIDQLLVHQQIEILEVLTGIEMQNKYQIKNSLGQQIYFAYEESGCMHRICCGPHRGFVLHITDNSQQEVMRVVRNFKCCAGCCWCADCAECGFEIQVEAPPGNIVGYAKQRQYFWKPELDVQNAEKDTILKIRGPCCLFCTMEDIDYKVMTPDLKTEVGLITKQWGGCFRECITKADNFSITFPQDLDVKAKATLLATNILIEFMIYEQQKNNNNS